MHTASNILYAFVGVTLLCGHVSSSTDKVQCSAREICAEHCQSCTVNGTCCACSPKWYGRACNLPCHVNCYTCANSGECTTCNSSDVYGPLCGQLCGLCVGGLCSRARCTLGCVEGYYQTPINEHPLPGYTNYHVCDKCPDFCTSCTSSSHCTSCTNKRWGKTCDKRKCTGNRRRRCKKCDIETGACLDDCALGQYLKSDGNCYNCPKHCRSCTSRSECTECKNKHRHGETCDKVDCTSIPNCINCSCSTKLCEVGDIICSKCDTGYTGETCERNDINEANSPFSPVIHQSLDADAFRAERVDNIYDDPIAWEFKNGNKQNDSYELFRGAYISGIFVILGSSALWVVIFYIGPFLCGTRWPTIHLVLGQRVARLARNLTQQVGTRLGLRRG